MKPGVSGLAGRTEFFAYPDTDSAQRNNEDIL